MRFATSFVAAAMLVVGSSAFAGDLQPLMNTKGKQLLSEDFSGGSLPSTWKAAKGQWTVADGALKGVRLEKDNHPGVLGVDLSTTGAVFQFDFKLGSAPGGSFSLNDSKGHVCRVNITGAGFTLIKDGSHTDKADVSKTLDSCAVAFKTGEWHTMMVEINGDEMVAHVDDQHYGIGSEPKINREKTIVRFTVVGDELSIDNLKIWEASAKGDWTSAKSKLEASHPAKLEAAPKGKAAAKKAAPKKK